MNKLYRRLAFTNMKNNKQFYLPYILTSIVSVMLFYCVVAMSKNEGFSKVRGGSSVLEVLALGDIVIAIFVVILMLYTNSFIMKRRKKELGVYNILGMEKRHIAKVLFIEAITSYAITITLGLLSGIAFNKLFSMILYKITGLEETIPFYISGYSCVLSIILFVVIYLVNLIFNLIRLKLSNPIELLHGSNAGEREPKTKIIMTLIGIVSLGYGYYLALTTENPIAAITMFFTAVLLVIIGTYALFTSGSIAVLKLLKKNKNYYYQTRHFTSVSGMMYRMKQNAVGLGNICILSTMVLVMVSSTVCMYAGLDNTINNMCNHEIDINYSFESVPSIDIVEDIKEKVSDYVVKNGREIEKVEDEISLSIIATKEDDQFISISSREGRALTEDSIDISFYTRQEYEKKYDMTFPAMKSDQVAVVANYDYDSNVFNFHGTEFEVVSSQITECGSDSTGFDGLIDSMLAGVMDVIVEDNATLEKIYEINKANYNEKAIPPLQRITYSVGMDFDGSQKERAELSGNMEGFIASMENVNVSSFSSKALYYEEYMMMHGGIFFLGLFLGVMFLMITVLIIYYKQISEGYEDRERFAIMEKVGMSSDEVKSSIRSQVRTVFFLPLCTATIHLAVAFPMVNKILSLMCLANTKLFVTCIIVTVLVFAVIYYVVFKLTSKTYYRIVGNQV